MRHPRDNARTTAAGIGLGLLLFAAPGCQLAGVMAASNERYGSHDVDAAYTGLWDKSFAVVAWADRAMQAEYPALVPSLIERIDLILAAQPGNKTAAAVTKKRAG